MKSDGELLTLTCHDEDKDMFQAATLSLGALGVIVSLKLQCEPAFRLQQVQYSVPLKDVRTLLPEFDLRRSRLCTHVIYGA